MAKEEKGKYPLSSITIHFSEEGGVHIVSSYGRCEKSADSDKAPYRNDGSRVFEAPAKEKVLAHISEILGE